MLTANEIAMRLGLKKFPRSWRGRCPSCDYATTFSVRDGKHRKALFYCSSCQDKAAVAEAVAHALGQPRPTERVMDQSDEATRRRKGEHALRLWNGSRAAPGTPAETYLNGRGLPGLAASPVLRFREDTPHPEGQGAGAKYPAMIALVTDADNQAVAIHRTFLRRDGTGKAEVEPAKASLGPVWGGAIRLQAHDPALPLVIGEGIETAASAGVLMGFPAWAALSAGNLAKGLLLAPQVRHVVIAADPDGPGWIAARDAWIRWREEGRETRIATPDGDGDFNDLLNTREANHA